MKPLLPLACTLLLFSVSCKKNSSEGTLQTTGNLNFTKAWSKVAGGTWHDEFWSGTGTADGGYVAVGYTGSTDGDITGYKGAVDALVIKYDGAGNKAWQTLIGGSGADYGTSIQQLGDGSFVGVGYSSSNDGDITGNHGGRDAMMFKLSNNGTLLWVKAIGSADNEAFRSMIANADGSFTMAGYKCNSQSEAASFNAWICNVDANGTMIWEKTHGGTNSDNIFSIVSSGDGGYVFAGQSTSTDGDVVGNDGGIDLWMVKIDGNGNKIWQKTFGGSGVEWSRSIVKSSNGYIIVGKTASTNGDVTINYGQSDAWILKVDENGNKLWQKTFGGSSDDYSQSIVRASDGGYLVSINTISTDGSFSGNKGYMDAWLVKLDENGNNLGQYGLGGSLNDEIFAFVAAKDGSYVLLGSTNSPDGDISGIHGDAYRDGWILKFKDQP